MSNYDKTKLLVLAVFLAAVFAAGSLIYAANRDKSREENIVPAGVTQIKMGTTKILRMCDGNVLVYMNKETGDISTAYNTDVCFLEHDNG